jgi:Mitochondrial morphogenesis regulator
LKVFELWDKIINFFLRSSCSELKSPTVHLIREIYDGEHAHESFILDLDRALTEKFDYIIIEPAKVADETSRWIMVGNCLHKTAVLSGLASAASGQFQRLWLLGLLTFNSWFLLLSLKDSSGLGISQSARHSLLFRCSARASTQSVGTQIHAFNIR